MRITAGLMALGIVAAPSLAAEPPRVQLYKTPGCDCCEAYAEHLRAAGFEVAVEATPDLEGMTAAAGVPSGLEGCHLALVDGYAVSGHVPVPAVQRLLAERPDVAGITLPGMPAGSPGMGEDRAESLTTYAFGDAAPVVFSVD